MITFRGAVLVAIGIFTFLLTRLTQVGWLYLRDAALWGVVLFSFVLPGLSVMTLSVRRRVVRLGATMSSLGPSEGETVQLELWLDNGRRWPRYFLSVSYDCPIASPAERGQRFFVPRLDGGDSLLLASDVECHRRGLHAFGIVTVESKAPFGLFRRRVRLQSPLSVLVYPQVFPLQRLALLEGTQGTAARPQKTRLGQEVAGSSSPSEDYLAVLAGQRQWIATTNFAGCPGRPPDSFGNSAVLDYLGKVPDALGWPIDPCFPMQIDPKAEQFEQVVAGADQQPFAVHLLQTPQQELPESPALLELAEYRLHSLHPQSVALPTPPGL